MRRIGVRSMSTSIEVKLIIVISMLIICFSYSLLGIEKFHNVRVVLFDRTPGEQGFTPSLVIVKKVTTDDKSIQYSDLLGISHKSCLKYLVFFSSDISKFLNAIGERSIFQGATSIKMEFIPKVKGKEAQCYEIYIDKNVYQIEKLRDRSVMIRFDLKEEDDYRISIWGRTDVAFSVYRMEVDGKLQEEPFTDDKIFFINDRYFPKFIQFLMAFIPTVTTDYLHLEEGIHEIRLVPIVNASRLFIDNIEVVKK